MLTGRSDDSLLTTAHVKHELVGKIGVLRSRDGAPRCTAFCLSSNLIATASHCLRAHPGDTHTQHTSLAFQQSIHAQTDQAQSGNTGTSKISGLVSGGAQVSFRKPIQADRDWAILRLKQPICTRGGITLASPIPSNRRQFHPVSLLAPRVVITSHGTATLTTRACKRQDLNQQTIGSKVRTDFSEAKRLMFHNCDAGLIASGAPILIETLTGLEVVAMHVGTYVRSRILSQDSATISRVASKPIANIAIPVEEFIRPVKDLLSAHARKLPNPSDKN